MKAATAELGVGALTAAIAIRAKNPAFRTRC